MVSRETRLTNNKKNKMKNKYIIHDFTVFEVSVLFLMEGETLVQQLGLNRAELVLNSLLYNTEEEAISKAIESLEFSVRIRNKQIKRLKNRLV